MAAVGIFMLAGLAFVIPGLSLVSRPETGAGPMEFDHLAIHVHDLARSVAFYEHVLGLKQIPEPFHDHNHVWFRVDEHVSLHVVGGAGAVSDGTPKRKIDDHFAFATPSLDEFMELLERERIPYRNFRGNGKVSARPDGVRQIYFQDPDGFWIEVNDGRH